MVQVNAEGRAIAGGVRGGTWLQNRRVAVQKRGDPLGGDGGLIHYADNAHAGEGGWVKGRCVLLQCACWVCGVGVFVKPVQPALVCCSCS